MNPPGMSICGFGGPAECGLGRPRVGASVRRCSSPDWVRRCWTREGFHFTLEVEGLEGLPRFREPLQSALLTLPILFGHKAGSVDLPRTETAQGRLVVGMWRCGCPYNDIQGNVYRWRVVILVFVVSLSKGLFLQVGLFLAKSEERYLLLSKPFLH